MVDGLMFGFVDLNATPHRWISQQCPDGIRWVNLTP